MHTVLVALIAALPMQGEESDGKKLRQVILTFKTHFDIGYTEMAHEVVQKYRTTMIDKALAVCDQNRDLPREQQFVWTIPGWPMAQILYAGQTPERRRRVLEAFKDGRFVVHALPFTTHTETLEPEDLVRGLGYSTRLARSVGLELPRDAKMTDVPCHSWVMPTLLKHAGVDFLHLGCNAACASPEIPSLFLWEGPDGSRLLTMYMASGYGSSLTPPDDWPYATWLALIHTGDNQGPPRPEHVRGLLEKARATLPGVEVRIGRLSDFADAILAEKPDLPVVRGDMPDTWIHGPLSDPLGAKMARNVRPLLPAAEALNTHLQTWGAKVPDGGKTIAAAYEQSLLYGEHTWGGALWWIKGGLSYGDRWKEARAQGKFKRIESSWEEHSNYIRKAHSLLKPVLEENLHALARAVEVTGPRVVVYNPLPWKRNGLVTLKSGGGDFVALRPAGESEQIPLDRDGTTVRFLARDVPPMGYRTYVPTSAKTSRNPLVADHKNALIENRFFKVQCDPARGRLASLVEKGSGREWIDPTAPHGFGQLLYERFDRKDVDRFVDTYLARRFEWALNELGKSNLPPAEKFPYQASSPLDCLLRITRTDLAVTARMKTQDIKGVLFGVTQEVTLYRDLPFLDVEVTLEDKPADPWPEAGWLCLPLRVESPSFRLGRLGSIVDPEKDIIRGSNHHLLCLHSGAAVINDSGLGVGLCPVDTPMVSLEKPGLWRYSKRFIPTRSWVYVNLFNNQWTTNFRLWNSGSWTSRVRLWGIDRYDAEGSLVTPVWEARHPLLGAVHNGPAGDLPPSRKGLEISPRGVMVTAFGWQPHKESLVLRLWEQAGKSGKCSVNLPKGLRLSTAQPCDLRGRAIGSPIPLKEGRFEVAVRAFAPVSLLLR